MDVPPLRDTIPHGDHSPETWEMIKKNKSQPLYYRWGFRPSDGHVELAHNNEGHPAYIRNHTDLAKELGEGGTYHGYAYRIGGGWRLMDWEHKPVTDPFVTAQVLRSLRGKEGPMNPHPELSDWTEEPDDKEVGWDRFHYGLPQPPPSAGTPQAD